MKKNKKADAQRTADSEAINQSVRTELLTAYFLQSIEGQVIQEPGETNEQVKQKAMHMVQDRIAYIKSETSGSYDINSATNIEQLFNEANTYGELMQIRRKLQTSNETTSITITNNDNQEVSINLDNLLTNVSTSTNNQTITADNRFNSDLQSKPNVAISMYTQYQEELANMFSEINAIDVST